MRGRMPTMEVINERFARNIRIGLFNFIRKSPEVSIGGIKVQKYSAFLREIVVPTNFNIVSVKPLRGSGLIVCDPNLVFAVIDALFGGAGKYHTRIEGRDFSPTEQRVIPRLVEVDLRRVQEGLARHLPARAGVPALGDAAAVRQHRHAQRDRRGHHASRWRSATPRARSTSASRTRRSSRSATCCTARMQGDANEPDRRWVNLLKTQIQSAEVELVAELATAPATVEQLLAFKPGDFIELDLDPAIQAKVDGVPVLDCHYGTANGRYAIKIDRLISSSNVGWLGAPNVSLTTPPCRTEDAMAAEWAAAAGREQGRRRPETASEVATAVEQAAPAPFANFAAAAPALTGAGNDINMILDIPVQLTVELGRTRIPIKHILQLAQGSVVELETLAGEPMDVLVNGYLIAQGEVVVVNDKFGIRLTDIVTPSERMRRLSKS